MNQAELPSLQAPSMLKKITQLLLSVSVFSLLLSHHSLGPSFLHSLCFYLSTVPVQLFTHTLDKNCIFLLCNGLLVFVAKYSGFISSSSTTPTTDDHQPFSKCEDPAPESKMPEDDSGAPQENIAVTKEDEFMSGSNHGQTQDREIEELIVEDEEEKDGGKGDGETGLLITLKEGDHESHELSFQEHDGVELMNDDQEFHTTTITTTQEDQAGYYDDGEGNGVLSTHELNKKFEEFIRKTKEEIRIEAQLQYLVMVK